MSYDEILQSAHEAASAAILRKFENGDREKPFNCGFAWVTIDGRTALARHCRKLAGGPKVSLVTKRFYGSKSESGWKWWKPGSWPTAEAAGVDRVYQQDMDFHYAASVAFAEVLKLHGFPATAHSMLD